MHTELRVVMALLLALLGLEVAARVFESRLSKDVAHLRSLPAEAERLRNAPAESLKVLILGNSLAREGLDCDLLVQGLENQSRRRVVLAAMTPDGSRVEEWLYGYRRHFEQAGAKPDLVLLCTGRAHLLDGLSDLSGVVSMHVSWRDLPGFISDQGLGVGEVCQAAAARGLRLFALRRRVQPLLFYHAMPRYEATVNLIQAAAQHAARTMARDESARCLASLLRSCRAAGTRVVVLSVPLPEAYELPVVVADTVACDGGLVLESPPYLPAERFPDGYHLNADGAYEWTRFVVSHPLWLEP